MVTPGGIGGLFNSPEQAGILPYVHLNEPLKEASKTSTQVGTGQNITLAKEIDEVPLFIKAGHIGFQQSIAGKPILESSWIMLRQVDKSDNTFEALLNENYRQLRERLPNDLKQELEINDKKPLNIQNTELKALGFCLQFEAQVLTLLDQIQNATINTDLTHIAASKNAAIPQETFDTSVKFAHEVLDSIENYIQSIAPDHSSYTSLQDIMNETHIYLQLIEGGRQ